MRDPRPADPEEWAQLVEDLIGPEWSDEPRLDQLVELVRSHGDPHAVRQEIEGVLD